jgi:hypothetical protein
MLLHMRKNVVGILFLVCVLARIAEADKSDADKMCDAAEVMLADGWHAKRPMVLATLATRFSETGPSEPAMKLLDELGKVPAAKIPGAWRDGLKKRRLPAPACKALDKLLGA